MLFKKHKYSIHPLHWGYCTDPKIQFVDSESARSTPKACSRSEPIVECKSHTQNILPQPTTFNFLPDCYLVLGLMFK